MTTPTNRRVYHRGFWVEAFERALKTAAQAPLTAWVVGDGLMDALQVNWEGALGLALGGFVVSILTSVASAPVGPPDTPSVV